MKKTLTTLVLTLSLTVFAQQPIKKTVGEFKTLKVYDLINVELIKSDENKVEITGKNASDVVIVNRNGTLKIRMNLEEIFDGNKTDVKLYYTSVETIDANEGAYIASKDKIKQDDLELKAQEGGYIKADIKVADLDVKAYTGGIIELDGKANNTDLRMSTGAVYKGKDLQTVTTRVSIKAGGEAYINTSELLDIKIRAGGDVYVYGNPNTVHESRVIGGRIKHMN